jgi:hypothetical protein
MRGARQAGKPLLSQAMRAAIHALTSLASAALLLIAASPAAAATYIVNINNALDIGTAVSAQTGLTIFRINPATGGVSVLSGAGSRLTAGQVRAMVTISCQPGRGGDNCNGPIQISVGGLGTPSGRAKALENFTVSMITASLVGGVTGTDPITFTINGIGNNSSKTFFVGADFPLFGDDSGKPTGNGENSFFVNVLNEVGTPVASDTDKGRVRALRALTAAKTADLNFGRIGLPPSGNGTITLDATGNRSVTGAIAYPTPAPTSAAFTVTGEGGQTFSASVPPSIQLTGPGTITVTTTHNLPATPTLSGALGAAGTLTFGVGGSFVISPSTPTGAYTGTLMVSIDYN